MFTPQPELNTTHTDGGGARGLTGVPVVGVRSQSESAATGGALEAASMEEQTLSAETLHHINLLLTEETDVAAAGRDLQEHRQEVMGDDKETKIS